MPHLGKILTAGLIVVLVGIVYMQHKENQNIFAQKQILEKTLKDSQDALRQTLMDVSQITSIHTILQEKERRNAEDIESLRQRFEKSERDFEMLAREKPALVEDLMNKGTQKQFDCFEDLSKGMDECK